MYPVFGYTGTRLFRVENAQVTINREMDVRSKFAAHPPWLGQTPGGGTSELQERILLMGAMVVLLVVFPGVKSHNVQIGLRALGNKKPY